MISHDGKGNATLTFTYDSGGRQAGAATSGAAGQPNVTLTAGYDGQGTRTTLSENLASAGVTTFAYDKDERLTTVTNAKGGTAGPQVVYGYDPASRLTSVSRSDGGSIQSYINTTIAYDAANRVATIAHYSHQHVGMGTSYADTPLATYVYGYDNADRLISSHDAYSQYTTTSYDVFGNKTAVVDPNGKRTTFAYDAADCLTTTTDPLGHSGTYAYDLDDRCPGIPAPDKRILRLFRNGKIWLNRNRSRNSRRT